MFSLIIKYRRPHCPREFIIIKSQCGYFNSSISLILICCRYGSRTPTPIYSIVRSSISILSSINSFSLRELQFFPKYTQLIAVHHAAPAPPKTSVSLYVSISPFSTCCALSVVTVCVLLLNTPPNGSGSYKWWMAQAP